MLDHANVEYIKWDMNRSISDVYSIAAREQGMVLYNYVLGVYEFLEKLMNRYPDILIEGCSGGGGRFDAGMLYYTPQIWCSDNTDAVDRTEIQYGTSLFILFLLWDPMCRRVRTTRQEERYPFIPEA